MAKVEAETKPRGDVCVLSTVDEGFRIVFLKDARVSSSDATHRALPQLYATRLNT